MAGRDIYWDQTSLLINGNGGSGPGGYDIGPNKLTVTSTGHPQLTPRGPFETTDTSSNNSVYFCGNNDYLYVTGSDANLPLPGDFTIEGWFKDVNGSNSPVFDYFVSTNGILFNPFYSSPCLKVLGQSLNVNAGFVSGSWNHFAIVRSGNTVTLYANGVSKGTLTVSGGITYSSTNLSIGKGNGEGDYGRSQYWAGFISNFRVVKGTAVYTSNFTPPTTPLTAITNTILLACQSSTVTKDNGPLNLTINNNLNGGGIGALISCPLNPFNNPISVNSLYTSGYTEYSNQEMTSTTANANLIVGTGDFTLEGWFNPQQVSVSNQIMMRIDGHSLWLNGGKFKAFNLNAYSVYCTGTTTVVNNQWYHVAMTRSNGSIKLYVNGVQEGSTYNSDPYSISFGRLHFGDNTNPMPYPGFISNARYSAGVVRYTGTFSVPTTDYVVDASTTALLFSNTLSTPTNSVVFDASSNKVAVTTYGTVTQGTFSPYTTRNGQSYISSINGGSAYFNGTGSLNYTDISLTGDFTIDCWVYPTILSGIIASEYSGADIYYFRLNYPAGGYISWQNANNVAVDGGLVANKWQHLALTRTGSNVELYVNGVRKDITTNTRTFKIGNIGSFAAGSGGSIFYNGYISNFRVINGTALYSGTSFTVPTTIPTNPSNTSLYLPFSSGSLIYDQTGKNDILIVNGVKIAGTTKKYNNSSIYFDGSGDYLLTPGGSNFAFNTGDFTIEMWVNISNLPGSTMVLYSSDPSGTYGLYPTLYINSTGAPVFYFNSVDAIIGSTLSINTWYHIAVSRSGTSTKLFVNGTQVGSTYIDSNNYLIGTNRPVIGTYGYSVGTLDFNGYIDDIRITKGIARYTTNFSVPNSSLPTAGMYPLNITTNFLDQGTDIATKYVTKSYLMDYYPNLIPALQTGLLYGFGDNSVKQLLDGTTTTAYQPVLIGGGWKYIDAAGSGSITNFAGIKTDGTLWTWGYNNVGQLGDGTTTTRSSPVTVAGGGTNWSQVSCAYPYTAAIKTDGTLWTWGYNDYGQLGTGNTTNRSSPGTVAGGGTNWKQVSCASTSNAGIRYMAAIKTDGTLWTWGYNAHGQLGDGTLSSRLSPITTSGGGTNWKYVTCGYKQTAAIQNDTTVWMWGENNTGQLGDGTTTNRSSPVPVVVQMGYKTISTFGPTTAAVAFDGTAWVWGNTPISTSYSPVSVVGSSQWKTIKARYNALAGIQTDGSLWTCGYLSTGELGLGYAQTTMNQFTRLDSPTNCKQLTLTGETSSTGWGGKNMLIISDDIGS